VDVAALAKAYSQSNDAATKVTLATQLLSHFLDQRDGKGLIEIVQHLDKEPFVRALVNAHARPELLALAPELTTLFLETGAAAPRLREELHYPLRKWAEEGADLTALTSPLEACFAASRGGAVLSSSTLTFFHAHREGWDAIDRLLVHPSEGVRWGCVRALSEFLARHPAHPPATDRLALALTDHALEVRKESFKGLEQIRKAGHVVHPTPRGLATLAPLAGTHADVAEVLYAWVVRNRDLAARVRDLLPSGPLRTICEDVVAGVHAPPCPICANLDAFECAGHESGLPKESQLLIPKDAEIRSCPTCGTRYHYAWSEMYADEFGSTGTYDVRRLDPSPGSKSLDELRGDLDHPPKRVQTESARELTGICLAEGRWDELRRLLAHPTLAVRFKVLFTLSEAAESVDLEPLVAMLMECMTGSSEDAQHAASTALARHFIRRRDFAQLRRLLQTDLRMVRWAALCRLADAAPAFDLTPLLDDLRTLAKHPDDFIHESAQRALRKMPARG
jgi:hypothetical protein